MPHDNQSSNPFFFEDNAVGFFADAELPSGPDIYPYVPYRSLGHYRLRPALEGSGPQRCHFLMDGKERHFRVKSCPAYGRLELTEFETEDKL